METIMAELYPKMVEWRRYLHQFPELSYQEFETSKWLQATVRGLGEFELEPIGQTSFIATISGRKAGSKQILAFRTDIDALPIQEETGLSYASVHPGVMHACGHDFHMAMILGFASLLGSKQAEYSQTVRLIFQSAEEIPPGGAKEIVDSGKLTGVDFVYGCHVFPNHTSGSVGVATGAITASQDIFKVKVIGKGSHGAMPEQGIDPILIASQIVTSLNHITSRNVSPFERAVISLGQLHAGDSFNVIPDTAYLEGNVRTANETVRALIKKRIAMIIAGVCETYGGTYQLEYLPGYSPVINDEQATENVQLAAEHCLASDLIFNDPQKMVSEDFSEYGKVYKSCFIILGGGLSEEGYSYMNHHPKFQINEQAMINGVKMYWELLQID